MLNETMKLYDNGKKGLQTILRDRAYEEVRDLLNERGIDIDEVSDEDIEPMVEAKVQEMNGTLKGVAYGSAFGLILSAIIGA